MGLRAFEQPKAVATPQALGADAGTAAPGAGAEVVVVVPAQKDGFEETFLGEHCWHAIRIAGGKLHQIKYIAGHQTAPVSAVTHYAPVKSIEPYGEEGKYRLMFTHPAKPVGPIPFGDAPLGAMQGPRYTTIAKLLSAKMLTDLF